MRTHRQTTQVIPSLCLSNMILSADCLSDFTYLGSPLIKTALAPSRDNHRHLRLLHVLVEAPLCRCVWVECV